MGVGDGVGDGDGLGDGVVTGDGESACGVAAPEVELLVEQDDRAPAVPAANKSMKSRRCTCDPIVGETAQIVRVNLLLHFLLWEENKTQFGAGRLGLEVTRGGRDQG